MPSAQVLITCVRAVTLLSVVAVAVACGGTSDFTFPSQGSAASVDAGAPLADGATEPVTPVTPASTPDGGGSDAATITNPPMPIVDASIGTPDAAPLGLQPTADGGDVLSGLTAITSKCAVASNGSYATDRSATAQVDICKLNGAYFWTADLAIDCDGQKTAQCNATTDSTWSDQTSIAQSNGQPLIASELPFVVVPLPSTRFDYTKEDIKLGALAVVIYDGQVMYGIVGDEGPQGVIGDASYAMAASLGLDPTPKTGGTPGPVTYIVLTGTQAVVSPVENHTAAVTLASGLVPQLIANN